MTIVSSGLGCVQGPHFQNATDVLMSRKATVLLPRAEFELLPSEVLRPTREGEMFVGTPVGPKLRARRRRAGLTLSEVARPAGIREETLSRIENCHTDPPIGTVQSVLRARAGGA